MKYLTTPTLTGEAGAILSDCEQYRYRLWREWERSLPVLGFIMLNPSTAEHLENDRTIARCIARAVAGGYGRLEVVNLFPLRSTDPNALLSHQAPLGDEAVSDSTILEVAGNCSMLICAWGAHQAAHARSAAVMDLLRWAAMTKTLHHLALNKDGSPKHPLYIAAATKPMPYRP